MKRFVKCFFELLTQNSAAGDRATAVVQMVKGFGVEIFCALCEKILLVP